jgi:hypothetical protein
MLPLGVSALGGKGSTENSGVLPTVVGVTGGGTNAASLSLTVPTGTVAGDLILMIFGVDNLNTSPSTNLGAILNSYAVGQSKSLVKYAWATAGSAGSTVTFSGTGSKDCSCAIVVLRGLFGSSGTSWFEDSNAPQQNNSIPSLTSLGEGRTILLIAAGDGNDGGHAATNPNVSGGFVKIVDITSNSTTSVTAVLMGLLDIGAGETDVTTVTSNDTGLRNALYSYLLKPAA